MKSEYINPFLSATVNVLSTMAMVKPEPGKPYVKQDKKCVGDISGIIGLTGASKGAIVLSFSTGAVCKIVGSMLGETYTEINSDIKDAVGELTNMISGDARRRLAEIGAVFEAGIPTIITGSGHEVESVTKGAVIAMPFTVDGHVFVVEASFDS
ncbi:MAG: chemotaxis protein CheX [Nitrospinae bacterium]|nr:chemotaxis protein CheX [Nitrospinota bacterium]MBF0634757.1 chemotaxis protein CheX [Nitrospinota bacterium]